MSTAEKEISERDNAASLLESIAQAIRAGQLAAVELAWVRGVPQIRLSTKVVENLQPRRSLTLAKGML